MPSKTDNMNDTCIHLYHCALGVLIWHKFHFSIPLFNPSGKSPVQLHDRIHQPGDCFNISHSFCKIQPSLKSTPSMFHFTVALKFSRRLDITAVGPPRIWSRYRHYETQPREFSRFGTKPSKRLLKRPPLFSTHPVKFRAIVKPNIAGFTVLESMICMLKCW